MQQRMKAKGVEVFAVSVDADQGAYQNFLKAHKVNLLTVRDPDQKSNNLYGTFKFPETYIIDRQGVLRRKFIGAVDWGHPKSWIIWPNSKPRCQRPALFVFYNAKVQTWDVIIIGGGIIGLSLSIALRKRGSPSW